MGNVNMDFCDTSPSSDEIEQRLDRLEKMVCEILKILKEDSESDLNTLRMRAMIMEKLNRRNN